MDRADILRAGAAVLTGAVFVGSAGYVLAHPKNDAAPLQPPAATESVLRTPAPMASPSTRPPRATTPRITLAPGVKVTEIPGITFTHVS